MLEQLAALRPVVSDVDVSTHTVTAEDGTELEARWYSRQGAQPGSAALHIHGGGMILGTLDNYDSVVRAYVSATGVPMFAIGYRLAPEFPHPVPVRDCFAGLRWLADHATDLGVDPARIAVVGDSAGGGLAAGVALLARDRGGPELALQLLVYPMLDDRSTNPDPEIAPYLTWTYDDNITGWGSAAGRVTDARRRRRARVRRTRAGRVAGRTRGRLHRRG